MPAAIPGCLLHYSIFALLDASVGGELSTLGHEQWPAVAMTPEVELPLGCFLCSGNDLLQTCCSEQGMVLAQPQKSLLQKVSFVGELQADSLLVEEAIPVAPSLDAAKNRAGMGSSAGTMEGELPAVLLRAAAEKPKQAGMAAFAMTTPPVTPATTYAAKPEAALARVATPPMMPRITSAAERPNELSLLGTVAEVSAASAQRLRQLLIVGVSSAARVNSTADVLLMMMLGGMVVLALAIVGFAGNQAPRSPCWRRMVGPRHEGEGPPASQDGSHSRSEEQQHKSKATRQQASSNCLYRDLAAPAQSEAAVGGRASMAPYGALPSVRVAPSVQASVAGTRAALQPRTAVGEAPGPQGTVVIHLCPTLVVPDQSECTLLVPRLQPTGRCSGELPVKDLQGGSVFCAKYREEGSRGKTIVLQSTSKEFIFASCTSATACRPSDALALSVLYSNERQFGVLSLEHTEAGNGYTLNAQHCGVWIQFRGDALFRSLCAIDEESRVLAIAEPEQQNRRRVRIGPHVDAGLISLALMGIDLLEHQASEGRLRG